MPIRFCVINSLLLLLINIPSPAFAREITVSPSPAGEPVLAAAIRSAAAGDTLHVKKGIYRETIVLDKRLQMIGDEGAIIDPSQPFRAPWRPAPEVGKGVYRAAADRKPYGLMLDGKFIAEIDERRADDEGPWNWKTLLVSGTPRSGFRMVRALWMYRTADHAVYLHMADEAAPERLAWSAIWDKEPAITFRGAVGTSVLGLTLAHGFGGVTFLDHSARCSVSQCLIGPWEHFGVLVTGDSADCLVERNRIFRGAYEEWTPDGSKESYEIWQVHKNVGFYDRIGVGVVRAGANNRVHANHIWETFDGIDLGDSKAESLDIPLPNRDHGKGTEISENIIERTRDSGIELGVGCIDVRVHHNTLRRTHGGLRYKLPRIGPVFIYRNLLVDGPQLNIWYSMDDSPAEGYVYHNTIVGGAAGLVYGGFRHPGHHIGAPSWRYYNNVVVTRDGFFANGNHTMPVNFSADYNLVVGGGKPWPDDPAKDRHSLYVKDARLSPDCRPLPGCPAIGAGLDLSIAYHGKPLPGCEPGYFKGAAPDIGAFQSEPSVNRSPSAQAKPSAAPAAGDPLYASFQNPGSEAKPMVFWFWPGNDVSRDEIVRHLDLLHEAGITGASVELFGKQTGSAQWLSADWWRTMQWIFAEAKKRNMQIDLNSAYAWPNGGTFVRPEHRLQAISCFTEELAGPRKFEMPIDDLLAKSFAGSRGLDFGRVAMSKILVGDRSVAFVRLVPKKLDGLDQVLDISGNVSAGTLSFQVPKGDYILYLGIHRAGAKRGVHSGLEGDFTLDHFSREGVKAYLDHIAKTYHDALGGRLGDRFHAFFVDSIEMFPANWTNGFADEFRCRRGYDLMPYIEFATALYPIQPYRSMETRPDLFTASPQLADVIRRVRYDYSKTLVELYHDNFVEPVQQWCRTQKIPFRFQAYGHPWNIGIGENYMVPDIPEGNNWAISDTKDQLWEVWNKYAAAGGHLRGKHVISCEAMTTSKGKFHETLDLVKRADDFNFITGVTRSVVHCFCYSPVSVPPPGQGKYGTFLSVHNPWWPYLPRWTQYNARLSQLFQMADPVIDVAILCPTADAWSDFGLNRQAMQTRPRYGYKLWESLSQQGLSADYLHEGVIQKARFDQGRLIYGPMSYNLLVLCDTESLEPETAAAIERYVHAGGELAIVGKQPSRSPGLANGAVQDFRVVRAMVHVNNERGGRVVRVAAPADDADLLAWTGRLLDETKTPRRMTFSPPSPMLFQVQYRSGDRDIVFLCNQDPERRVACRANFPMGAKRTAWRWDPETGKRAVYSPRGSVNVAIDLAPAESLLLVFEPDLSDGPQYQPPLVAGRTLQTISGPWDLTLKSFRGEKSELRNQSLVDLASSPSLNKFAGVIEYQTTFNASPDTLPSPVILDLGKINGVSEAWLNGQSLGARWYGPHQYPLASQLKAGDHQLRVKVSTLLFNAMGKPTDPRESTGMHGPVLMREAIRR